MNIMGNQVPHIKSQRTRMYNTPPQFLMQYFYFFLEHEIIKYLNKVQDSGGKGRAFNVILSKYDFKTIAANSLSIGYVHIMCSDITAVCGDGHLFEA
jgi:hypothetical protein